LLKLREAGSPPLVGLTAEITAYVLEQEAQFINSEQMHRSLLAHALATDEHEAAFAVALKYSFTLIRRIVPRLVGKEIPGLDTLVPQLQEESFLITNALLTKAVEQSRQADLPSPVQLNRALSSLAERIQQALKTFKDAAS
jgi:hypothetical protein